MADLITDAHVSAVLRAFVRGSGLMIQRLREKGEPVDVGEAEVDGGLIGKGRGRLARTAFPGSQRWERMDVDERSDWWISRVGRLTSLVAALPGGLVSVGEKLPLQDVLGTAGQGLLLCAMASEHGIDDDGTKVRLLAAVLFNRDIAPAVAAGDSDSHSDGPQGEIAVDSGEPREGGKFGVAAAATLMWRQGRMIAAVREELENRPKGGVRLAMVGRLPGVGGIANSYLGERSALKRCASAANEWIAADQG
jgi:hypothetical protein